MSFDRNTKSDTDLSTPSKMEHSAGSGSMFPTNGTKPERDPATTCRKSPPPLKSDLIHFEFSNKHARLLEQAKRAVVEGIIHIEDDLADTGVDDHLGALKAGRECRVYDGVFQGYAVIRSLDDRVFFAVRAKTFVQRCSRQSQVVATRAPALVAIPGATRCAVIAGRNDPLVLHNDGGDFSLHAI